MKLCSSGHTEIAWADGGQCPMCALMASFEEGLKEVAIEEHCAGMLSSEVSTTEAKASVEDRWPQIKKMGGL